MGDKRALMAKAVFGVAAIVYCAVLSLRPIPAVNAPNDTGRYVDSQEESCRTEALGDESDNLPQRAFNLLVRPTCQAGKYRVFLFCISLFLPAALMLFGDWSADGALFLMLGFLFSAVGFELMTNALRQTASLAFLLAAISFRVRWAQFAALACALLLHDSSWVFIPCALYVNRRGNLKPSAKRRLLVISGSAAVAIVGLIALEQRYSAQVF
jgi:hypothetical protein